jgi:ankyrin repeat protein
MSQHDLLTVCGDGDITKLTDLLSKCSPSDNLPLTDMLEKAASAGHSDVIQYLFTFNPSHTTIDDHIVRAAIYSGSKDTFNVLSAKSPMILNLEQERRGTPLAIALTSQASQEYLLFLLSQGADPNIFSEDTLSPLSLAAGLYDLDAVKLLLEHGARINGSSALAAAASRGKVETVKYLLECGADPNDGGNQQISYLPLHSAVEKGHKEIVELLIEHNANPHIHDVDGQTALSRAQKRDNEEIIRLLNGKS